MQQAVVRERWPIHGLQNKNLAEFKSTYNKMLDQNGVGFLVRRQMVNKVAERVFGHLPKDTKKLIKDAKKRGIKVSYIDKDSRNEAYGVLVDCKNIGIRQA